MTITRSFNKVADPVATSAFSSPGFEGNIDPNTGDLMPKRPGDNWVKASALK